MCFFILNSATVRIPNGAVHPFFPLVQEACLLVSPDVGPVCLGDDPDKDEEEAEGESSTEGDAKGKVIDSSRQLVDEVLLGLDRDICCATKDGGEVRSR